MRSRPTAESPAIFTTSRESSGRLAGDENLKQAIRRWPRFTHRLDGVSVADATGKAKKRPDVAPGWRQWRIVQVPVVTGLALRYFSEWVSKGVTYVPGKPR